MKAQSVGRKERERSQKTREKGGRHSDMSGQRAGNPRSKDEEERGRPADEADVDDTEKQDE